MVFKTNRHKQDKWIEKAFAQRAIVSVISIFICIVALCSSTWAWFSENISASVPKIQSSSYGLDATIKNSAGVQIFADNGIYSLDAGETYTIILCATGNATAGYCEISWTDGIQTANYYTEQILPGDAPFEFTLITQPGGSYTFNAIWGTYSGTPDIRKDSQAPETPIIVEQISTLQQDPVS